MARDACEATARAVALARKDLHDIRTVLKVRAIDFAIRKYPATRGQFTLSLYDRLGAILVKASDEARRLGREKAGAVVAVPMTEGVAEAVEEIFVGAAQDPEWQKTHTDLRVTRVPAGHAHPGIEILVIEASMALRRTR